MAKENQHSTENRMEVYGISRRKRDILTNIADHVGTTRSRLVCKNIDAIIERFPANYREPMRKDEED